MCSKGKRNENQVGPFFCATCKGQVIQEGFQDIMEDWTLHAYLWANKLPEDEHEQIWTLKHTKKYLVNDDELQLFLIW